MEKLKTCTKCKGSKTLDNFTTDRSKKDGLKPSCNTCQSVRSKVWYQRNKEKARAIAVKSYNKRKLKVLKRRKVLRARPEAKQKASEQFKSWNKRNPLKAKINNWKRSGIACTPELYEKMLKNQKRACAICKISVNKLTRMLDVDHCHTTGKVRGLLCAGCNLGLGSFKDSQKSLEEAIIYLKSQTYE